jgi:hypothetical protein
MSEGLARSGYGQEAAGAALLPVVRTGVRMKTLWAHAANDNRMPLWRRAGARGALLIVVVILLALLATL